MTMALPQLVKLLWNKRREEMERRAILIKIILPISLLLVVVGVALGLYFGLLADDKKKVIFEDKPNVENPESSEWPDMSNAEIDASFTLVPVRDTDNVIIGYQVSKYIGEDQYEVIIPDSYTNPENGQVLPVIAIGENAFSYSLDVRIVKMPDTITNIYEKAFYMCENLEEIRLSNNLEDIGEATFSGCVLKSLFIPAKMTALEANVCSSFMGNSNSLESIIVDKNNPKYYSQDNCLITKDGGVMVLGCANSKIPYGVTWLLACFYKNEKIEYIEIPETVTVIEEAFYWCDSLKEIKIPDSVLGIAAQSFLGCVSLEKVVLGKSVVEITPECFLDTNIKTVEFYCDVDFDSQTYLLSSSVNKVVFNEGVKNINAESFAKCSNLRTIVVSETNSNYYSINKITKQNYNCVIDRVNGNVVLGAIGSVLPTGAETTVIGEYAFAGRENIKTIAIPSNIRTIRSNAFLSSGLVTLTIPSSITTIEDNAFSGCSLLKEIINNSSLLIEKGQTTYGSIAANADIVKGLGEVSDMVYVKTEDGLGEFIFFKYGDKKYLLDFDGTSEILILPESFPGELGSYEIVNRAFYGNEYVREIYLNDNVIKLGQEVFAECENLRTIELGNSIEQIDVRTFENCTSLLSVKFPDSLKTIGNYAFSGCISLEEVVFNYGLEEIGDYAFLDCGLKQLILPETLLAFGQGAFFRCFSIEGIRVEDVNGQEVQDESARMFSRYNCLLSSYVLRVLLLTCKNSDILAMQRSLSDTARLNFEMYSISLMDNCPEEIVLENAWIINTYAISFNLTLKKLAIYGDSLALSFGIIHNCPNLEEINWYGIDWINSFTNESGAHLISFSDDMGFFLKQWKMTVYDYDKANVLAALNIFNTRLSNEYKEKLTVYVPRTLLVGDNPIEDNYDFNLKPI